jgi:hypothetical protein
MQDTGKHRKDLSDKFYTNPTVATACLQQLIPLLDNPGGFVWIEPSAGAGAFLTALKGVLPSAKAFAVDLTPAAPEIEKGDFMTWRPPFGRRIIFGNPPFGKQGSAARQFIARATYLNAKWIAFILPRSFEKPSLQTAFPLNYHNRLSVRLGADAFIVNGTPYDVPCVFQVWERMETTRHLEEAVQPTGFSFVKSSEPHEILIRRVGVYAGRAFLKGVHASPQSHYYIQPSGPIHADDIIEKISAHVFPSNTTGPRSISKGELAEVLNVILAAAAGAAPIQ